MCLYVGTLDPVRRTFGVQRLAQSPVLRVLPAHVSHTISTTVHLPKAAYVHTAPDRQSQTRNRLHVAQRTNTRDLWWTVWCVDRYVWRALHGAWPWCMEVCHCLCQLRCHECLTARAVSTESCE